MHRLIREPISASNSDAHQQDVAVDLEGEGDVGAAEGFADHAGVLARGEVVGGVGVPEPVEGEAVSAFWIIW